MEGGGAVSEVGRVVDVDDIVTVAAVSRARFGLWITDLVGSGLCRSFFKLPMMLGEGEIYTADSMRLCRSWLGRGLPQSEHWQELPTTYLSLS